MSGTSIIAQIFVPLRMSCIYKKIHYLTFDLGVKVTGNVAQYPPHHVTYAPAKFEVATPNGLKRIF